MLLNFFVVAPILALLAFLGFSIKRRIPYYNIYVAMFVVLSGFFIIKFDESFFQVLLSNIRDKNIVTAENLTKNPVKKSYESPVDSVETDLNPIKEVAVSNKRTDFDALSAETKGRVKIFVPFRPDNLAILTNLFKSELQQGGYLTTVDLTSSVINFNFNMDVIDQTSVFLNAEKIYSATLFVTVRAIQKESGAEFFSWSNAVKGISAVSIDLAIVSAQKTAVPQLYNEFNNFVERQ